MFEIYIKFVNLVSFIILSPFYIGFNVTIITNPKQISNPKIQKFQKR